MIFLRDAYQPLPYVRPESLAASFVPMSGLAAGLLSPDQIHTAIRTLTALTGTAAAPPDALRAGIQGLPNDASWTNATSESPRPFPSPGASTGPDALRIALQTSVPDSGSVADDTSARTANDAPVQASPREPVSGQQPIDGPDAENLRGLAQALMPIPAVQSVAADSGGIQPDQWAASSQIASDGRLPRMALSESTLADAPIANTPIDTARPHTLTTSPAGAASDRNANSSHGIFNLPAVAPRLGSNLYTEIGVKENRDQGLKAEEEELKEMRKIDRNVKFKRQVCLYVESTGHYMVADILTTGGGVTHIHIKEIKSGDAKLSPRQIEAIAEGIKTGRVYIVNDDAAKKLDIKPRITFAEQHLVPLFSVIGGNQPEINRQLRNNGLEVLPEGSGRVGRMRIGVEPN